MRTVSMKKKLALITKLERELAKTCQRIYELSVSGRRLTPVHPFILVRVLPKEHKTEGGIWLADTSQNKPVYEGIVIDTWKPYKEHRYIKYKSGDAVQTINHECMVQIGERVVFPHYEGVALGDYLDDKYYRLVRESSDQSKHPYMQVLGKLDYKGDAVISAEIRKLTLQLGSITTSGVSMSRGAQQ